VNLSGNKILITGGGSGIGIALLEKFQELDNTVIICGRRASVLKEVTDKHPDVITRVCDLTSESERVALFDWISREHADLNILVNNAGIQNWMKISDDDFYQKAVEEIAINVYAPLHLLSLFGSLPSLHTVMNVTSGLAFTPLTKVPVYSATKAFFHSFTLSARHLLKSKNIKVIELIPPALNTDLGGKGLHDSAPPVSDFIDAAFVQLAAGKDEVTFGFSEAMSKATPAELKETFNRMNPPE
jgi:uncharacterized oxidoreductase